jgi:hypothetical protein
VPDCPDILISVRHPKKTFATWVIPGIEPDKRKGIIKDEANERSPGWATPRLEKLAKL